MNTQQDKPLPTIWRVPDELWHNIQPILDELDFGGDSVGPNPTDRAKPGALDFG